MRIAREILLDELAKCSALVATSPHATSARLEALRDQALNGAEADIAFACLDLLLIATDVGDCKRLAIAEMRVRERPSTSTYRALGDESVRFGNKQAAAVAYRKALELSPGVGLDHQETIARINGISLPIPPINEDEQTCAHIDLAIAYAQMNRFQDAHTELQKALERDPSNIRALYWISRIANN